MNDEDREEAAGITDLIAGLERLWRVVVWRGAGDVPERGIDLGPVALESIDSQLVIWSGAVQPGTLSVHRTIHRSITVLRVEFVSAEIRVEGLEEREDGSMVRALWIVQPYDFGTEEKP